MEILSKAVPVTMLSFVVSSMLGVGLSLTVGADRGAVAECSARHDGLLANFVLMPLAAVVLARLLRWTIPSAWVSWSWARRPALPSCPSWLDSPRATWPSLWA